MRNEFWKFIYRELSNSRRQTRHIQQVGEGEELTRAQVVGLVALFIVGVIIFWRFG